MTTLRLGAYILPGDPVWLRSSLTRYYRLLDEIVVPVPTSGRGWTGKPLPVEECLAIIRDVDTRRIVRTVEGDWVEPDNPMAADTAQRQAAVDALGDRVDWILQLDNDEVLPDVEALVRVLELADQERFQAVEWPLRVLYRRVGESKFLAVCGTAGRESFEYPGPIAVKPRVRFIDARRVDGGSLMRLVVSGDDSSLQLTQLCAPGETRRATVTSEQAVLHNSWGRSPASTWRKTRTWGHAAGAKGAVYYLTQWLPSPLTWRFMRNFHPFADGLWQTLRPFDIPTGLLEEQDR